MIVGSGDYVIAPSSYDPDTIGPYALSTLLWQAEVSGCGEVWVTRGITISDSIKAGDCVDSTGPYYADAISIVVSVGTVLTITEQSTAFDAALFVFDGTGVPVAQNLDSADTGPNAHLSFTVPATNRYFLFAATQDTAATGAYTLTIAASTTAAASSLAGLAATPSLLSRMPFARLPKLGPLPRSRWFR